MKKLYLFVLIFGTLIFSGCISQERNFSLTVNSINEKGYNGKSYILVSGIEGVDETDLYFKEYSKYINNALDKQGYKHVDSKEKADLEIEVLYFIGADKHYYSYSNEYSNEYSSSNVSSAGEYNTFPVYLRLRAYDLKHYKMTKKKIYRWETTVTTNIPRNDLRLYMPYLVDAMQVYIGKDSSVNSYIVITSDRDDSSIVTYKEYRLHYSQNDKMLDLSFYSGDEKDGNSIEFDDEGRVKAKGEYKYSSKTGEWIYYNKDGSIKEKKNYDKEKL